MGKPIISQRRGKGSRRFISLRHRYKGAARHKIKNAAGSFYGTVLSLEHSPAHSAPIARIQYADGETGIILAPEGIAIGDTITMGKTSEIKSGNTLQLADIPEGTLIYNIEIKLGDGGKMVRASGTSAKILSKTEAGITLLLPSKKTKIISPLCRATIGNVAGGGRLEKPFMKTGKRWHAKRARGKLYPIVSAVAMNPVEHPFGCGRGGNMGKPSTPPKHAPPGRKEGQIRARRTGRKR